MANTKYKVKVKDEDKLSIEDVIDDKNPIIRKVSNPVPFPLSKYDRNIMNQMIDYVRASQEQESTEERKLVPAFGISAVQIGELQRMFYVRIQNDYERNNEEFALINPEIVLESKEHCYLADGEDCLSVKDGRREGVIERPHEIRVRAIDYFTDQEIEITARSITAIVLQHELDHLNGVLYYDRINRLDPQYANKKSIKIV